MCLTTVDKEVTIKEGVGWKYFDKGRRGRLSSSHYGERVYPIGKWITDKSTGNAEGIWGGVMSYPMGFHVFTKPQVDSYRYFRQVKFRNVVAQGTQESWEGTVVVAREMFIERKTNANKKHINNNSQG